MTKRAYSPSLPEPLDHLKPNYKGKNEAGGRKVVFSQSREYTLKDPLETWYRRYIYPGD